MDFNLAKIIITLITGGLLVYLAVTVWRDNMANRLNRLAGALLFFAGLGPLFVAIGQLMGPTLAPGISLEGSTVFNLHYVWELFFPILLIFSWTYPIDRLSSFRHPSLRYFVFLPVIVHIALALLYLRISSGLVNLEAATTSDSLIGVLLTPISYLVGLAILAVDAISRYDVVIFGVVNLLYMGIGWYFIEVGHTFVTNPRLRNQSRLALWGFRSGLGIYGITLASRLIWGGDFMPQTRLVLSLIAPLIAASCFAYAIVRHQLFDVRSVFRHSFVYTLTSAMLVGLYILTVFQSEKFLTPLFGEQAETVSYLFVVLILLLFQPINNALDNFIRSMFMRTRGDYRNVVERFSRQIISMFDPRHLRQTIEETLKTSLLIERVYFVLYDDSLKEYAFTASADLAETAVVERDDLMLRGINLLDSPTTYESLTRYVKDSELAERLKAFGVKIILPMKDADHLLGFLALTDKVAGYRYTAEDINLLGVLSNQMVSALTNARLYVESLERIRLQEEVNMARTIQINLLPTHPPEMDRYSICAGSTPSRTVGGDFYDFIEIENSNRLGVVIADASGKGMPAALMIAQIQAIIRSEVSNGNHISTILKNTNRQIVKSSSPETYVTLFYGELDADTGVFHYANAGHNYPIVVRADGSHQLLETGGPIIGAFESMEYHADSVRLNPGDLIFFFTDGLSEAMNTEEVEYGEIRIRDLLVSCREHEPQHIMDSILADVYSHSPLSPPADDTTVITVKMKPNCVPTDG